jgi:C4-dicarboxylate-specific signal transduction histidine kinase
MPEAERVHPYISRYGIPLFAAACALGFTSMILPILKGITFLPLLVAVAISAWYGRHIGGLVAVALGCLGSAYFHLPPLYTFRIAAPDDAIRLAVFVLAAGGLIWFLHSRHNLSDQLTTLLRQAAESERNLRQKQEEVIHAGKLATLGQLAAGITHELNNPLNNVNLYLGMLRDLARTQELDYEKVTHAIDEAQGQVRRAAEVVSHVRLFARGGEAPRRPCCIDDVIHRALSFVQEPLRLASVTATFTRSPIEILIEANETQMEQVFVNLLLNAKDAMSHAPMKWITITSRQENGSLIVDVDDTGPGIAPAIAHVLFTPFITTKPSGAGLGLGLSICSNIMTMHHGHIGVGSNPAGGARFMLTLPVFQSAIRFESAPRQVPQIGL